MSTLPTILLDRYQQQPHLDLSPSITTAQSPRVSHTTVSEPQTISLEDLNAMESSVGFRGAFAHAKSRQQVPIDQLVTFHEPLTEADVILANAHAESGAVLGVPSVNLKAIRHTHHRLAQLLAGGMDETIAGKLCNYSPSRVSILKADPAFAELLTHYTATVDDEFADFTSAAAALSIDMLGALQEMLDTSPEKFGPGHLMDAIKLLADRTGHAPVTKSIAVNVNADVGARLNAARERLRNVTP